MRALRDRPWLLGPEPLWASDWFVLPRAMTTVDDVRHWPSSVGLVTRHSEGSDPSVHVWEGRGRTGFTSGAAYPP